LLGAGDVLTWPEWVKKWGEFNGVQCTYEELPIEEFYKYYPGNVGLELGDMYKYISDYGYDGSDPSIVLPWDVSIPYPTPLTQPISVKLDQKLTAKSTAGCGCQGHKR